MKLCFIVMERHGVCHGVCHGVGVNFCSLCASQIVSGSLLLHVANMMAKRCRCQLGIEWCQFPPSLFASGFHPLLGH